MPVVRFFDGRVYDPGAFAAFLENQMIICELPTDVGEVSVRKLQVAKGTCCTAPVVKGSEK